MNNTRSNHARYNNKSGFNKNRNNGNNNNYRNNVTSKQRHQNRARATLLNELVVCSLPSLPLTNDNKVFKQIITEGTGSSPLPTSVVAVNYVGRLPDGTIFDSSVDPQLPCFISLRKTTMVSALEIGILSMKVGEKCLLSSSFEYGFGELGCPPRVPAAANLQYEVELFNFNIDLANLDDGTVEGKMAAATEAKKSGNHFFHVKMYRAAVHCYKMAESRIKDVIYGSEGEEKERLERMIVILNLNLAACALKSKLFDIAIINCDKVLTVDPSNIKGLFRLSQAHTGKQEFASAKRVLLSAIKLHPNDSSLRQEFESVKEKEVKYKISEEGNLRGFFNKENADPLFSEEEKQELKQEHIALANARMFF